MIRMGYKMTTIEVKQYSLIEAVDVDSDYNRAEQEFYEQWSYDIDEECSCDSIKCECDDSVKCEC